MSLGIAVLRNHKTIYNNVRWKCGRFRIRIRIRSRIRTIFYKPNKGIHLEIKIQISKHSHYCPEKESERNRSKNFQEKAKSVKNKNNCPNMNRIEFSVKMNRNRLQGPFLSFPFFRERKCASIDRVCSK